MRVRLLRLTVSSVALATGLAAVPATAGAQSAGPPLTLPGDALFPEGIARRPGSSTVYVGSTTDGSILRGPAAGGTAAPFLPGGAYGMTTAAGLEADRGGRLYVAGGATGRMFVVSTRSGGLIRRLETGPGGFVNDQTATPRGDVYFTDSLRPVIWRVRAGLARKPSPRPTPIAPWRRLGGSSIAYGPGFNLNGIVSSPRGTYLLAVQSNTGRLFRIATRSKEITPVDLRGRTLKNGDGLLVEGNTLYAVRNAQGLVAKVALSTSWTRGRVVSETSHPDLRYPTTAASFGRRLLLVNAQFNRRNAGEPPELPFTVSSIPKP